ncbi:MAG TPA: hypothetical protein VFG68_04030 [Fimbriiglobus sp.]|nr:hypothetical protein [Fimbriiglobus sp.]
MSPELLTAIAPLVARFAAVLDRDPALRRELADFARALADWIDAPRPAETPPPEPAPAAAPPALDIPPSLPSPPPAEPVVLLTSEDEEDREPDLVPLSVLVARCRLKADAAGLIARRLSAEPVGAFEEADLTHRAAVLPNCFLWMLDPRYTPPSVAPPKVWADLAGGFHTAAAAADLLAACEQAPAGLAERATPDVLALAAEAQSVLWYAVADTQTVQQDFEQVQLYIRVIEETRRLHVYVPRYLKRDHRTDPASWPDVARRVAEVAARLRQAGEHDKVRRKAVQNLRHKLTKLRDRPDDGAGEWPRIVELIDEAVAAGLPPSNVELRELLLPVRDQLPEDLDLSPAVARVFREIDRYLDERPSDDVPDVVEPPTPEVAEVASLLRGREAVLIGGHVRPDRRAALIEAFGLADLNWVSTPEHTSTSVFEAPIARPEVAVVLLTTRWSNHDYQNVKDYCEQHGKLFVKLPAGYHPNQVAHQVLGQVGDRLRAGAAR